MKKLLSLFFVAALSVSAWASIYNYDAKVNGEVGFQDLTYVLYGDTIYKYQLTFAQTGRNRNGGTWYSSNATIVIMPLTKGFVGTFYADDLSGTEIVYNSSHRVPKSGSNLTIAQNANGTYTISGYLKTQLSNSASNTWNYYYSADTVANTFSIDFYPTEPAQTTINLTGTSLEAYDYMLASDGLVELDIYDDSYNQLTLGIMNDTFEIPAGTYNVADTEAKGTILKSKGMNGYTPYHSYFYSSSYDNYFIVGGSLTVSYSDDNSQMTVSGALTTGHESTINVSVTAANPFYVAPDPETYERDVTAGNFGTICLSRKFTEMTGVDGLYIPAYKDNNILYCDEVALEDVVAGNGYIFKANAAKVTFTYDLNDSEESASLANNMRGWLATKDTTTLDEYDVTTTFAGYALLAGNQIVSPQAGSKILKNRAMIYLQGVDTNPTPAPERGRRISFGTNTATGMVDINATRMSDVHKFVNNGQLIIIRNGVKFNAMGQEL